MIAPALASAALALFFPQHLRAAARARKDRCMDTNSIPPLASLDYRAAPRGPINGSYSLVIAAIAWAVIIACVGYVAFLSWRASKSPGRVEATEDVQLLMTSRVLVGALHRLPQSTGPAAAMPAQAIANLERTANPKQSLRLVSVVGELQGKQAAQAALDQCASALTDPADRADLAALRTIYSRGPDAVSTHERTSFIAHEGWFAKLALSFGQPDDNPLRASVLHDAKRAAIAGIAFEAAIGIGFLAGLALLIIAIVLLATGKLHRCYGRASRRTTAFLEAFALYLVGYISIGLLARKLGHGPLILGPALSLGWILFAALWPLLRGVTWQGLVGGLGWYRGQGIFREAGAGIVGYLTGLPIIAFGLMLAYVLSTRTHTLMSHPIVFSDTRSAWAIIQIYLLASVFAPLVEETMFRGALFNHLRQRHGWLLSAAVSSFLFAALHPQGWAAIPAIGGIGFVLASIREWRGTFIASAAAHALNNGVVTTLMILTLR
jgi:membrane protease YdiL (CAAX protease family)